MRWRVSINRSSTTLVTANLFLLLFLGVADNQMIAALLPSLVKDFGISVKIGDLLVVVYSLATIPAAFVSGALSDEFGRGRFLQGAVVLFAVASGFAYASETFFALFLARALVGLAAGTLSTCSIALAGDWFPYQVRGKAIGLISSAYFVAPIVGVPLASFIAQRFGWRSSFLFSAGLALLLFVASSTYPDERLDVEPTPDKLRRTIQVFVSFLTRRDTAAGLVIAFLVSGGLVGFLTFIGIWLNSRFNLSTGTIGLVFGYGGAVAVASAPLGGILSDHLGKRAVSVVSSLLLAISVALVPFFSWGVWLLVIFGATSVGAAFRHGPITALMTELVPAPKRGTYIALRNICSQLGIGATVFAGGFLYQSHGYPGVTMLSGAMTLLVAVLLATHIAEPAGGRAEVGEGRPKTA